MKIAVADNEQSFDLAAAWRIINYICAEPRGVIGLSTGRTTGNIHRLVCEINSELNLDTSHVTFFGARRSDGCAPRICRRMLYYAAH